MSIATLQCISKILQTSDLSIYFDNALSLENFMGYEDEITFILDHYEKYGNVPDIPTFMEKFTNDSGESTVELVEVHESDDYLVDTLREEALYTRSAKILNEVGALMKTNSNEAMEYWISHLQELQPNYSIGGVDIVKQANERYEEFKARAENPSNYFFESGFKELDEIIHGIQRSEELLVILARTNQGKSWILEKICSHIWKTGYNVGYLSPEMSASTVGFRFDTLFQGFSNSSLQWGRSGVNEQYETYIKDLSSKENKFIVTTPRDFNGVVTVSKLRNWVRQQKLDVLAIDGLTYLRDERGNKNDNKTVALTNICEDLMALSVELKIPIISVVQSNRDGASGEAPEIEHIRDSDGISHNASKILSIIQKQDNVLEIAIKKQRNGAVGGKVIYSWDIDTGEFSLIPNYDDAQPRQQTETQVRETKSNFKNKDKRDVF